MLWAPGMAKELFPSMRQSAMVSNSGGGGDDDDDDNANCDDGHDDDDFVFLGMTCSLDAGCTLIDISLDSASLSFTIIDDDDGGKNDGSVPSGIGPLPSPSPLRSSSSPSSSSSSSLQSSSSSSLFAHGTPMAISSPLLELKHLCCYPHLPFLLLLFLLSSSSFLSIAIPTTTTTTTTTTATFVSILPHQ